MALVTTVADVPAEHHRRHCHGHIPLCRTTLRARKSENSEEGGREGQGRGEGEGGGCVRIVAEGVAVVCPVVAA